MEIVFAIFRVFFSLKFLIVLISCQSFIAYKELSVGLNDKENDTKMILKDRDLEKKKRKGVTAQKSKVKADTGK